MNTEDPDLLLLSRNVGYALSARGLMLVTAESCTGGWVGQVMTMVPGSSEWYERGFVTYTYVSKVEMLGVRQSTLEAHGAVSETTAREMCREMVAADHLTARRHALLKSHGLELPVRVEN